MEDDDVQNRMMVNSFKITRVGITGVKKPLVVERPGKTVSLVCDFEVSVNLPSTQKGSHMSRNVETINEVVDKSVREPYPSIEGLARYMSQELLKVHPYATCSNVKVTAPYFLEKTFQEKRSLEKYSLLALARAERETDAVVKLGVTVNGTTVCPCAMENVRGLLKEKGATFSADVPVISHNQRNETTLILEIGKGNDIDADELIGIVEKSLSSPSYEFLKRDAEALVVLQAHENPKFVEDVVRGILGRIVQDYPDLPDATSIYVRSTSMESIHKHDAFAERNTTLGELRK